ncbi:MAG: hypothetical protein U5M53_05985 [Rhodoferax sp.]|nr:hypothetical protein [Rhodoferax sp.]
MTTPMAVNGQTPPASAPVRFSVFMLMSLRSDGATALAAFRQQAQALFEKHGVRVEGQWRMHGKGQIVGHNAFETPDLVQQVSFPSLAQFKAYVSDPEYLRLAPPRDQGLRQVTAIAGNLLDVQNIAKPGAGPAANRLYGVGLVRFKEGGSAGLDAFNLQAQTLFARHGMHVESMMDVKQILTPVGAEQGMAPERVVVFFLDDASAMKAYATDPEYARLAPLRDQGLEAYDFFLGTATMPSVSVSEKGAV